jgi:hypothetical protein
VEACWPDGMDRNDCASPGPQAVIFAKKLLLIHELSDSPFQDSF